MWWREAWAELLAYISQRRHWYSLSLSLSPSHLFPLLSSPPLHVLMCLNRRGNAADVIVPDSPDDWKRLRLICNAEEESNSHCVLPQYPIMAVLGSRPERNIMLITNKWPFYKVFECWWQIYMAEVQLLSIPMIRFFQVWRYSICPTNRNRSCRTHF